MRPRVLVLALVALVAAGIGALVLASHRRPPSGLVKGRLRPCPESPNCVTSQDPGDEEHHIDPLRFFGDPHEAFGIAVGIVKGWPRTKVLRLDDDYAHFEVSTRFLRFRDDLELHLDPAAGVIHVRSGSRVGQSDLGANRKRVERLRAAYERR